MSNACNWTIEAIFFRFYGVYLKDLLNVNTIISSSQAALQSIGMSIGMIIASYFINQNSKKNNRFTLKLLNISIQFNGILSIVLLLAITNFGYITFHYQSYYITMFLFGILLGMLIILAKTPTIILQKAEYVGLISGLYILKA